MGGFPLPHAKEPIHLHPGEALVFDGTLCHKGARQAREVGHASVAAHAYVGRELADLADSFDCLRL